MAENLELLGKEFKIINYANDSNGKSRQHAATDE